MKPFPCQLLVRLLASPCCRSRTDDYSKYPSCRPFYSNSIVPHVTKRNSRRICLLKLIFSRYYGPKWTKWSRKKINFSKQIVQDDTWHHTIISTSGNVAGSFGLLVTLLQCLYRLEISDSCIRTFTLAMNENVHDYLRWEKSTFVDAVPCLSCRIPFILPSSSTHHLGDCEQCEKVLCSSVNKWQKLFCY